MTLQPAPSPQRLIIDIDIVAGPFIEAVGERLLHLVTEELNQLRMDVTRTRVELHGRIATW